MNVLETGEGMKDDRREEERSDQEGGKKRGLDVEKKMKQNLGVKDRYT